MTERKRKIERTKKIMRNVRLMINVLFVLAVVIANEKPVEVVVTKCRSKEALQKI